MAWLSLLILGPAFLYTTVGGARDWRRFTANDSMDTRRYYYKKWIIDTWLALGLGAVAATWALGRLDLLLEPLPHSAVQADPISVVPQDSATAAGFYVGLGIGLAAALAVLVLRLRRFAKKTRETAGGTAAGTTALTPTNRQERLLAVQLSVAAGVAEELFFRAAVPVLVVTATRNVNLSLAAGIVLFGLYHYYQGIMGVLATAFIGFILTRLFMSSGTILAPMGLHIFIDLWALVILPAIMKAWRRRGWRREPDHRRPDRGSRLPRVLDR